MMNLISTFINDVANKTLASLLLIFSITKKCEIQIDISMCYSLIIKFVMVTFLIKWYWAITRDQTKLR